MQPLSSSPFVRGLGSPFVWNTQNLLCPKMKLMAWVVKTYMFSFFSDLMVWYSPHGTSILSFLPSFWTLLLMDFRCFLNLSNSWILVDPGVYSERDCDQLPPVAGETKLLTFKPLSAANSNPPSLPFSSVLRAGYKISHAVTPLNGWSAIFRIFLYLFYLSQFILFKMFVSNTQGFQLYQSKTS